MAPVMTTSFITEDTEMMTYIEHDEMNTAERVTRAVMGMALLEVILLVPTLSLVLLAVLTVAALYVVFSAIIASDPFHQRERSAPEGHVAAGSLRRSPTYAFHA